MSKTVAFKSPARAATVPAAADDWVAKRNAERSIGREEGSAPLAPIASELMKRFTIDVSEPLHKRIKAQCAMRGVKMADVIRDLLEREFPKA
jgi:predicted DNA binding CopG/RHH family protein